MMPYPVINGKAAGENILRRRLEKGCTVLPRACCSVRPSTTLWLNKRAGRLKKDNKTRLRQRAATLCRLRR